MKKQKKLVNDPSHQFKIEYGMILQATIAALDEMTENIVVTILTIEKNVLDTTDLTPKIVTGIEGDLMTK